MNNVFYKNGFKYQLHNDYSIKTSVFPKKEIKTEYINLYKDGTLFIKKGYAWDGASGPIFDTKQIMRGSLIHDALYYLMRLEKLNAKKHKKTSDKFFIKICLKDNMWKIMAKPIYLALYIFGWSHTKKENLRKILKAP